MDEWRLGTRSSCRFEQVQGCERIHFEIQEWNGRRAIMRWLRRAMHNQIGTRLFEQGKDGFAVSDIEVGVLIVGDIPVQAFQRPGGITFGPEKDRSVVIIDSEDLKTVLREE